MRTFIRKIARYRIARARRLLQRAYCNVSHTPEYPKQLLVDVSVISKHDAGTGIQRVVREIVEQLLSHTPPDYSVRLVAATRKRPYHYIKWDRHENPLIIKEKISVQAGDIFLGLDFSTHAIPRHYRQLVRWKKQGVQFHFILYDLLPLQRPEWFSHHAATTYGKWIKKIVILANSILCISRVVQEDLHNWCQEHYQITSDTLPAYVVPMGWNFSASLQSKGMPPHFEQLLALIQQYPSVLMVGTLEPRKGHADVLEAFECVWNAGKPYNFIIVGRPGWKTEALQEKIRTHTQRGRHLFWLDNASDEALLALYQACTGVMVASLAEGFGLPLLEALGHGKPVLARDLPIFREHQQEGIHYFAASDSVALSVVLTKWLDNIRNSAPPTAEQGHICTWEDTTKTILRYLGNNLMP